MRRLQVKVVKYNVNEVLKKCLNDTCLCKSCSLNGIEGMCLGCNECVDHKLLNEVTSCSIIKKGDWSGFVAVSLYGKHYISVPMGIFGVPEYFEIFKSEYDDFESWKNDTDMVLKIQKRKYDMNIERMHK